MKKIVKVGVLICCFIAIGSILYLRYLQFQKKEAEEREWEICIAYRRQNDALIRKDGPLHMNIVHMNILMKRSCLLRYMFIICLTVVKKRSH